MSKQNKTLKTQNLAKATRYLSKWLNLQDNIFDSIGIITLSCLVFFLVLWLQSQSLIIRISGYLFLVVLFFMIIYQMKRIIQLYERSYKKYIHPGIKGKYDSRFQSQVPLFLALLGIRSAKPHNIEFLLRDKNPLALKALEDAGVSSEETGINRSRGLPYRYSFLMETPAFYQKVNDFFSRHIEELVTVVHKTVPYTADGSLEGEFGILRDQAFLDSIDKAPEGYSYFIGGHYEKSPPLLNNIIERTSQLAIEEKESPKRLIDEDRKDQIRRLVRSGKLDLRVYRRSFKGLHMAVNGESILVQQYHKHRHPSLMFHLKKPDPKLLKFARGYIDEIKKSKLLVPVIYEE